MCKIRVKESCQAFKVAKYSDAVMRHLALKSSVKN